ncbi:hypothetical protein ACFQ3K_11655 [Brucella gallinifaecis]|nr:hypothetical protein [Brucella gallinifaecis]
MKRFKVMVGTDDSTLVSSPKAQVADPLKKLIFALLDLVGIYIELLL